jgi:hypothetical protein
MSRELGDLIDFDGLSPEDEARLLRVHERLIAAGPPEELPHLLVDPPPVGGPVVPLATRRRRPALLLVAALVAAACFGAGYLVADNPRPGAARAVELVSLQGTGAQSSFASLRVGSADVSGNWPIQLTVTGLPRLESEYARYVLMLSEHGRPTSLCGIFEVAPSGATTVTFNVPYAITKTTRWVVTEVTRGVAFPGRVVMKTV